MGLKERKAELLCPAGSYTSARAAVNAGADAIYMGGPYFSARAYAESSREEMLIKSLDYCHLRGVRLYLTLNTLVKEREFGQVEACLEKYADHGLDGVIVQDLGVMRLVRERFPGLKLHVSTQAAVTGAGYAGLLMRMGAGRIVLARELSLPEIRHIYEETGAELEVFAHGALCYSYSGECLMSSFIGARSGNRGRCAGTCRLPFDVYGGSSRINKKNEKYVLSMKDLCALKRMEAMLEAGVYSFKIEGRMKQPVYVAAVCLVYRKFLDMALLDAKGGEKDGYAVNGCAGGTHGRAGELTCGMHILNEVFDRGGTTSGYLDGGSGEPMVCLREKPALRSRDEELIKEISAKYIEQDKKEAVSAHAVIRKNEKPLLKLSLSGNKKISVIEAGQQAVTEAKTRALTMNELKERLGKFGDTDFYLEDLAIDMDEGCFMPVSAINKLRRDAAIKLKEEILRNYVPGDSHN